MHYSNIPYIDQSKFDAGWKKFYGYVDEEDPKCMLAPLGKLIMISVFSDADHAENVMTRRSHTEILIFANNALIIACSKRQNIAESSTLGSELVAMRTTRYLIVVLRMKSKTFGVFLLC